MQFEWEDLALILAGLHRLRAHRQSRLKRAIPRSLTKNASRYERELDRINSLIVRIAGVYDQRSASHATGHESRQTPTETDRREGDL